MAGKTEKKGAGPVWGKRIAGEAGTANVAYCAGWDVRQREAADLELLPFDLETNRAHCVMLCETQIIRPADLQQILKSLDDLGKKWEAGKVKLDPALEDVHLNVENAVAQSVGEAVSGLMHTARSRNDQVATDMRLWLREKLTDFTGRALELVKALETLGNKHANTVMPGLTHHQPAAWTTLGHWALSHGFAFLRDVEAMLHLLKTLNVCPLGAAASYGTSWPIDRSLTAKLLGFDGPQENSLDCVTNRSEFEERAAGLLALWAKHAATLSQDIILFSSPPWQLMRLGDAFVTGSSIMPQKRNPDFAEVTKAKAALVGALAAALPDLTRGDPSGYNREQQWAKYGIMQIFQELEEGPVVIAGALRTLKLDKKRMRNLMAHDFLEGADAADYLAQSRGVPFRFCYRWLGEAVRISEEKNLPLGEAVNEVLEAEGESRLLSADEQALLADPDALLERRTSYGGPAPTQVKAQWAKLQQARREMEKNLRGFATKIRKGRQGLEKAMERYRTT